MSYHEVGLGDLIEEIGEDGYKNQIANFSCPLDNDIEYFLKEKAVIFERMAISRTHLVYTSYKSKHVLAGYFAISNKPLNINRTVPKSLLKSLTGFKNPKIKTINCYLIGQLSKNYELGNTRLISGEELLRMAFKRIVSVQQTIGGRCIVVECADKPKLREFYEKYGFRLYGESCSEGENKRKLLQYIREIKGIELT